MCETTLSRFRCPYAAHANSQLQELHYSRDSTLDADSALPFLTMEQYDRYETGLKTIF